MTAERPSKRPRYSGHSSSFSDEQHARHRTTKRHAFKHPVASSIMKPQTRLCSSTRGACEFLVFDPARRCFSSARGTTETTMSTTARSTPSSDSSSGVALTDFDEDLRSGNASIRHPQTPPASSKAAESSRTSISESPSSPNVKMNKDTVDKWVADVLRYSTASIQSLSGLPPTPPEDSVSIKSKRKVIASRYSEISMTGSSHPPPRYGPNTGGFYPPPPPPPPPPPQGPSPQAYGPWPQAPPQGQLLQPLPPQFPMRALDYGQPQMFPPGPPLPPPPHQQQQQFQHPGGHYMQQHQHPQMHQAPQRQLGYNEWLTQQQLYAGYGPDAQQYLRPPQQPQQHYLQQYEQQQELTEEQKKLHDEELQRQEQIAKDQNADRFGRTFEIQKSMGYYEPGLDKFEYWTGYPQARKRDDNGEATYPRLWHDREV